MKWTYYIINVISIISIIVIVTSVIESVVAQRSLHGAASDVDAKDAMRIAPNIICHVEHIFTSAAKHHINHTLRLHIL